MGPSMPIEQLVKKCVACNSGQASIDDPVVVLCKPCIGKLL